MSNRLLKRVEKIEEAVGEEPEVTEAARHDEELWASLRSMEFITEVYRQACEVLDTMSPEHITQVFAYLASVAGLLAGRDQGKTARATIGAGGSASAAPCRRIKSWRG